MALDGLNAAAAAAILSQANVDQATKTRGVIVSAFVPGPLGLAVPFILAQKAGRASTVGGPPAVQQPPPRTVQVPDVAYLPVDDATKKLKEFGLAAASQSTYSADADKDKVIEQRPDAGELIRLGSTVTIFVGAGTPPAEQAPPDLDKDLTDKINQVKTDMDSRLDKVQESLDKLAAGMASASARSSKGS